MTLKDVMTPDVECVGPDDPIQEAARRMRDRDIGAVPVCGPDGRLVGVLTDRDIAVRCTAAGHDPAACPVRDAMSPGVAYCFDDQDMSEAAALMRERQIRRVLVLNRDRRLVGVVSLGDLALDAGPRPAGETLREVSELAPPIA